MKIIIIMFFMFLSSCGTIGVDTDNKVNEIGSYEITVDEKHPLVKFENGIKKTVEFAFEGMDPEVELLGGYNTITVSFSEDTRKLIDESKTLSDSLEDSSNTLLKTLGSMYNFKGTLIVDDIEFKE